MNVTVFTKDGCPYCTQAKSLLNAKNVSFVESNIGRDMVREDFISLYPEQKTLPLIIIDGNVIGGYTQLVEYFNNRPTLLTE